MYKMSVMHYFNFFLEQLLLYINNHHFCFAPVHFFCQFAVLRRPCDQRISTHVDLGQMKLALYVIQFFFLSTYYEVPSTIKICGQGINDIIFMDARALLERIILLKTRLGSVHSKNMSALLAM